MKLRTLFRFACAAVPFVVSASGHARPAGDAGTQRQRMHCYDAGAQIKVGETRTVDVGMAMGLQCDDTSIVTAELRHDSPTNNKVVLTGVRPGRTLCRAGNGVTGPCVLIAVTVER